MCRKILVGAQKAHPAVLDRAGCCNCLGTFAMMNLYINVKKGENFNS